MCFQKKYLYEINRKKVHGERKEKGKPERKIKKNEINYRKRKPEGKPQRKMEKKKNNKKTQKKISTDRKKIKEIAEPKQESS